MQASLRLSWCLSPPYRGGCSAGWLSPLDRLETGLPDKLSHYLHPHLIGYLQWGIWWVELPAEEPQQPFLLKTCGTTGHSRTFVGCTLEGRCCLVYYCPAGFDSEQWWVRSWPPRWSEWWRAGWASDHRDAAGGGSPVCWSRGVAGRKLCKLFL